MKNIFETIKANKGTILKRGLAVLGGFTIMTLVIKAISGAGTDEENFEDIEAENDSYGEN